MSAILRDLRFAVRGLRHNPGFTTAAVLTLALGIGATTAVFSIVYGVLVRPLPFPNAARLVHVGLFAPPPPGASEPVPLGGLSLELARDWRESSRTVSEIGFYTSVTGTFTDLAVPARLIGASVSPALFAALGVRPIEGRPFVDGEEEPGAPRVMLLAHDAWQRHFGGSVDALGRRILIDGRPHDIIGVMPPDFGFPSVATAAMPVSSAGTLAAAPEFWIPGSPPPSTPTQFATRSTIALLREGVSREAAETEAAALFTIGADGGPSGWRVSLTPLDEAITRRVRPTLLTFQAGVVFVLLIAWVNVANLLLVRTSHRGHEFAVRRALGAGGWQMARQVLSEALLVATAGGALGAVAAYGIVQALRQLPPHILPRLLEIRIDGTTVAFACALSILSGLMVGALASLRIARLETREALSRVRSDTSRARRQGASAVLVVSEIAAAVVLLACAGLLLNSFARLANVDLGIRSSGLLTFSLSLPPDSYPTPASQQALAARVSDALEQIPSVDAVAAADLGLLQANLYGAGLLVEDTRAAPPTAFRRITPGFFDVLGVPMVRGREFGEDDRLPVAATVIVNEAFAQRYFLDQDPIGRRLDFQQWQDLEIVGVVADIRSSPVSEIEPQIYLPADDLAALASPAFAVRSPAASTPVAREIDRVLREIDPRFVVRVAAMDDVLAREFVTPRFHTAVAVGLAAAALALALIGLYGVLAYAVRARTHEIGIRMAVGAAPAAVMRMVLTKGLVLSAAGIGIGLAGALAATQTIQRLLFDVTPRDPATLAAVVILFVVVSTIACVIPARRATRVDPVVALRAE